MPDLCTYPECGQPATCYPAGGGRTCLAHISAEVPELRSVCPRCLSEFDRGVDLGRQMHALEAEADLEAAKPLRLAAEKARDALRSAAAQTGWSPACGLARALRALEDALEGTT